MRGINDDEVEELISFCEREGVRTLKFLDVIRDLDHGAESFIRRLRFMGRASLDELYLPIAAIRDRIERRSISMRTLVQGDLGHPMTAYTLAGGLDVLLKDHSSGAWYGSICNNCKHYPCHDALMAIRVTADARIQFCLLREDVTLPLDPGASADALRETLEHALSIYETASFTKVTDKPPTIGCA